MKFTVEDGRLTVDWPITGHEEDPLELSIQKWQVIVNAYDAGEPDYIRDGGIYTCALCATYRHSGCDGCPVMEATGFDYCGGSPYARYVDAEYDCIAAAKLELEFLKGLRNGLQGD